MSVYGNTAIAAVEKIKEKYKNIDANTKIVITRENAVAVWEYAVQTKTESEASRKKGCPKAAFIGLCEDN